MIKNWKRAGIGACTAAALVVGAGLAFGPAANAATTTAPSTSGSSGGLSIDLGGLLGGSPASTTSPSAAPSPSPSTSGSGSGITVDLGGLLGGSPAPTTSPSTAPSTSPSTTPSTGPAPTTSSAPTTSPTPSPSASPTSGTGGGLLGGDGSVVVNVPSGSGSGIVIVVGGTGGTGGGGTVGGTVTGTPGGGSTSQPQVTLTALNATSKYPVIYPAKDGYLDGTVFALTGTASDGQQHPATGTAVLTFGSSTVRSWPITATDQAIAWDGLLNGHVVPGRYRLTATIDGAENTAMTATTSVDVSAKRLANTTKQYSSKSVSGTHRMAAAPLSGMSKGKVYLRVTSVASHVKGKQYLLFKHGSRTLKVRILNGKHTSKAILIPKSFTSYSIKHTWKKGTVKIKSLKYSYTYKALK